MSTLQLWKNNTLCFLELVKSNTFKLSQYPEIKSLSMLLFVSHSSFSLKICFSRETTRYNCLQLLKHICFHQSVCNFCFKVVLLPPPTPPLPCNLYLHAYLQQISGASKEVKWSILAFFTRKTVFAQDFYHSSFSQATPSPHFYNYSSSSSSFFLFHVLLLIFF